MSTIPNAWDIIGGVAAKYGDLKAKKKQDQIDELALAIKVDEYIRNKKKDQIQALRDEEDRKLKLENDKIARENALRTNRLLKKGERYVNPIKNKEVKMPLRSVTPKEISEAIKNKAPVDLGTFKRDIVVSPSKADAEEGLGQVLALVGKPEMQQSLSKVKEAIISKESAKQVADTNAASAAGVANIKATLDEKVAELEKETKKYTDDITDSRERAKMEKEADDRKRRYELDLKKANADIDKAKRDRDQVARIAAENRANSIRVAYIQSFKKENTNSSGNSAKFVDSGKNKDRDRYNYNQASLDAAMEKALETNVDPYSLKVMYQNADGTIIEKDYKEAESLTGQLWNILDNAEKIPGSNSGAGFSQQDLDKMIKDAKEGNPRSGIPLPSGHTLTEQKDTSATGAPKNVKDNVKKSGQPNPLPPLKTSSTSGSKPIQLKNGKGLTDKQFKELMQKMKVPE